MSNKKEKEKKEIIIREFRPEYVSPEEMERITREVAMVLLSIGKKDSK